MNLLELVTHLRTNILDDTGGQGVDWTVYSKTDFDSIQLRWTNEELVANINEAIRVVYRRIEPIKDFITIDTEIGKNVYTLPPYVLKPLKLKRSDGTEINEKSINEFWSLQKLDTATGPLTDFFSDVKTGTIRVYPIPAKVENLTMMVYRRPITELNWIDNDLSPELTDLFHIPMLNYVAFLSYMKDEANTLDPKRAETFRGLFNLDFPEVSAYSNLRKSRTANRPVRYGGL